MLNMALTIDEVKHIAKLSRIELTDQELEKFRVQLSSILGYIEKLNEVDTSQVPPSINTTGIQNRMRDDVMGTSLPQTEALKNSQQTSQGFFVVPNVFE
jgi:aspartyl-tRNA(Asn)/glutamyl-tRNA(Gln) amidotransferase subunit C